MKLRALRGIPARRGSEQRSASEEMTFHFKIKKNVV